MTTRPRPARSLRERLGRIALAGFVRGTATAAGTALVGLITWWLTHR